MTNSHILIYQTEDGQTKIQTKVEGDTVWLSQGQLCELFQKSKSTISEHIKNIFDEEELMADSVVRNFRTTAEDGKNYNTNFYNLDVIISVGYRVKSLQGTKFRQWATARLKEYIVKGFTMNDELLKNAGGGNYFEDLVRAMQIARGAVEDLRPINAGLLFFSETPEKFFPYTQIEVNIYHDDIGDSFSEKVFKGAIHQQLRQALSYIKSSIIEEYVQKVEGQAEAIRFYNYPFQAVEEALANAVYHKSYEEREPIKVNILSDKMEIISHGGAMPPLTKDDFTKDRVITMKYLNRRIGDFLKELHLTEGKGTGIPKIRRAMRNNGSQEPIFETDDARSYFVTILKARKIESLSTDWLRPITTDYDQLRTITDDYGRLTKEEYDILRYLLDHKTITRKEAVETANVQKTKAHKILSQLVEKKLIIKEGQARATHYILGDGQ